MDTGPYDPGREGRPADAPYPGSREMAARPPVRRRRLFVWLAVMAVIIAVLGGGLYYFEYVFKRPMLAQIFATKPPPTPVVAVRARTEVVSQTLGGIGTLAAVRQVTVSPEVGGRVTRIAFTAGARVRAGEPLVQLNDATEQSELRGFRAQAKLVETNLGRAQALLARQFSPQATVDQLQAQLDQARAEIQRVQALIDQKQIRAPFEGVLGVRQIDLGEYLTPGAAIVTLTDLSTLYVNFTLPEQARASIALDRPVRIGIDAYPGRVFEARITAIEPQVNPETRAIQLQGTLPNSEGLLLPGMFANAQLVLPPRPAVVTLPETVVDYTLYGDSVFAIREDGRDEAGKPFYKAVRTGVRTGERFDGRVVILDGLREGEMVVSTGQMKLIDGAPVTLSSSDPLPKPAQVPTQ
jgi:membrane fusion protein, multidrug efflux system